MSFTQESKHWLLYSMYKRILILDCQIRIVYELDSESGKVNLNYPGSLRQYISWGPFCWILLALINLNPFCLLLTILLVQVDHG